MGVIFWLYRISGSIRSDINVPGHWRLFRIRVLSRVYLSPSPLVPVLSMNETLMFTGLLLKSNFKRTKPPWESVDCSPSRIIETFLRESLVLSLSRVSSLRFLYLVLFYTITFYVLLCSKIFWVVFVVPHFNLGDIDLFILRGVDVLFIRVIQNFSFLLVVFLFMLSNTLYRSI